MGADSKIMSSWFRRGQVTILVAGIIVVFLLVFFVVGIDFARLYYVRGELQNAADAAALAGAKQLDGTNSVLQTDARQAAWKFACQNSAAKANVYLVDTGTDCNTPPLDLNNANTWTNGNIDQTGDIVVGNWDASQTPKFDANRTPINAVQVVARRRSAGGTAGVSIGSNPVGLLFGKLVGWSIMDVVRTSTAAFDLNLAATPVCVPTCSSETPLVAPSSCSDTGDSDCFPGTALLINPATGEPGTAWTNFEPQPQQGVCPPKVQPTSGDIIAFIEGSKSPPNVCGQYISTTEGTLHNVEVALATRWLSERQKPSGTVTIQSLPIQGWHTFIPVVVPDSCGEPPQACPGAPGGTPYLVQQYAEVVVTFVGQVKMHPGTKWGLKVVGLAPSGITNVSLLGCSGCSSLPRAIIGRAVLVR
jgi:Flp pilus assembly protein TadG